MCFNMHQPAGRPEDVYLRLRVSVNVNSTFNNKTWSTGYNNWLILLAYIQERHSLTRQHTYVDRGTSTINIKAAAPNMTQDITMGATLSSSITWAM